MGRSWGIACSGAAVCRSLRAEALSSRHRRRSAAPHPCAAGSPGQRSLPAHTAHAGRAVLHAPGIISPDNFTVKGARYAPVAAAMALRATLDCDLPRHMIAAYRKDGPD